MEKITAKNRELLIILIAMIIISISFALINKEKNDTLDVDRSYFSTSNTLEINKIEFKESGDSSFIIQFSGGKWFVNGNYPAEPSRIHVFFATIQQLNIRRPVSNEQYDLIKKNITENGSSIKLFKGETVFKTYKTWGEPLKSITYMMDETQNIFIVEIPGYHTFIYGLFSLKKDDWMDHRVFAEMNWRNLKSLELNYKNGDKLKFVQDKLFFTIEGVKEEIDTTKLIDFIDYVSLMNFEKFNSATSMGEIDFEISVKDVAENIYTAKFYLKDDDFSIAQISNGAIVEMKTSVLTALVKQKAYYLKN